MLLYVCNKCSSQRPYNINGCKMGTNDVVFVPEFVSLFRCYTNLILSPGAPFTSNSDKTVSSHNSAKYGSSAK